MLLIRYYISSLFFDVITQFYQGILPPDLEEKRKYAKYRAVQIKMGQPLPDDQRISTSTSSSNATGQAPITMNTVVQPTLPVHPLNTASVSTTQKSTAAAQPVVSNSFVYHDDNDEDSHAAAAAVVAPVKQVPVPSTSSSRPASSGVSSGGVPKVDALNAKKKCQHAISSIDFSDYKSAINLLQEAIGLLGGGPK